MNSKRTQLLRSTSLRLLTQFLLTVIVALMLLFHLTNSIQSKGIEQQKSFIRWAGGLLRGDFGATINFSKEIVFFAEPGQAGTESIGPALFRTLGLAAGGLLTGFIIALLLNLLSLFSGLFKPLFRGIKSVLEWLSSIHVIIIALMVYMLWKHETPFVLILFILAIGSNVYYEFSSEQELELKKLLDKDFVIAAKAWGDSWWKHVRRSLSLMSITQIFSMWIVVLANTLIAEIIFQRSGLGSVIYKYILATNRGSIAVETPILLAIIACIVFVVELSNLVKELLILYLADIRR